MVKAVQFKLRNIEYNQITTFTRYINKNIKTPNIERKLPVSIGG